MQSLMDRVKSPPEGRGTTVTMGGRSPPGEANGLTFSERNRGVIEQNMGLVHSWPTGSKAGASSTTTCFQAGCISLVKAADAFDYDRGSGFPPMRCR